MGGKKGAPEQRGSPRRLCFLALRLFPLRDLTGHIISAKNILRESGRREVGVGLHGCGGGGSTRDARVSSQKERPLIPLLISPLHVRPVGSSLHPFPLKMHQLAAAVAPLLQSGVSASEAQPRASGAPVVVVENFNYYRLVAISL